MNFNNFTIKSQEAVQEAVNLVQSRGQQAIEPAHILHGVMKVGENVTNFIFQKLGMNGQQVALVVDKQIDSLPKVSGGEPYLSRESNEVLQKATQYSKEMGDEFVSLEHILLRYNRIKTKTPISVEVLDSAKEMLDQLRNRQESRPNCPDYLFGILRGDKKRKDERAYREYQSALRKFNYCLKGLAKALHLKSPVTSYTLRHSWATTAKYRGVPIEMISESLGHKSIKTTQIYLKGFELKDRTEVNRRINLTLKNVV